MIQPPINFTQGDTANLVLTAVDSNQNPIDLTGAVFTTYINGPGNGNITVFPNSQHTANPDQVNFRGLFTLALSNSNTASCSIGNHKEVLTKIVIGASTVYFRGLNVLQVYPPVPLQ